MTTRVSAVLDHNIIHGEYLHTIPMGGGSDTVDVTVRIFHQFQNDVGTTKEIELESFVVPATFLRVEGHDDVEDVTQTFDINIANPRYLTNLFLETEEIRSSGTIVTKVPVLDGTDPTIDIFPTNPIKEPLLENRPEELLESPPENIIVPEPVFGSIVYSLDQGLTQLQASRRIYLEESVEFGEFRIQDFNEEIDRIFVEDSISNLLPNPDFANFVVTGAQVSPEKYEIEAPGLVTTSKLEDGDIEETNIWKIRASNPNLFNPMNSLTIKMTELADLFTGSDSLTFSVFHKIASDFGQTPFVEFSIKVNYYDGSETFISSFSKTAAVANQDKLWHLISASFEGSEVPLTAEKFDIEFSIADIETTEPFTLRLYLPQVEHQPYSTTRTLASRILDRYETKESVTLDLPLTIQMRTFHRNGSSIRGIFDSTLSNKDGVQFFASTDKLHFKQIDASGTVLFNIASSTFSLSNDEEVTYSVFFDGTDVKFFLGETLVSSHPAVVVLDQIRSPVVGSLNLSNTTINSEILDFRLLRKEPGT